MSIDDLIERLTQWRNRGNGEHTIYIKDADTGTHLKVIGLRESNNEPGRPLIVPESYSESSSR